MCSGAGIPARLNDPQQFPAELAGIGHVDVLRNAMKAIGPHRTG